MKTVVLESSLRKIVREELARYINEDKQEQVLEEGKLQQFLSGLGVLLGLGFGGVGAKLTSELPATNPTMAAMQSIAGNEQLGSDFAYNKNNGEIKYNNKVIGSILPKTEELIEKYFKIKGSKARNEFLKENSLALQELETIIDNFPELKEMQKDIALTDMTLLTALVLLIGGSMGLVLASEGGPATGLFTGRGSSVVTKPRQERLMVKQDNYS